MTETIVRHVKSALASPGPPPLELSENFYIQNKRRRNVKIQVRLSGAGIHLRRETDELDGRMSEQLIRIEDIIGSRVGPRLKKRTSLKNGLSACRRANTDETSAQAYDEVNGNVPKDTSAYLYIYAYIKKDNPLRRHQTVRILRFRTHDIYEENLKTAERWHRGIIFNRNGGSERKHNMRDDDDNHKQLLILLNPKSGSGKGRLMFQKQVAPVLKEAELPYELIVTTHANFARNFVRTHKDLVQQYSGVVVAAGDGLFFEVLNGLMERHDWQMVSRALPLGIIPCGSGNGLAKSIAHSYNEPYEPKPILNATLTCISGKCTPMDIVRVEIAKGEKHSVIYSFLSVGWGLIADIDIESERLRSIGAQRFTLWSVHRVIHLRTYKGTLSYLPWRQERTDDTKAVDETPAPSSPVTDTVETQEFYDATDLVYDDEEEFVDALSLDNYERRPHIDSWRSSASKRTAYYSLAGQSVYSQHQSQSHSISSKIETINAQFEASAPASSIPPLQTPVPDTWHREEGEYVMVHAAYTSHLAADCHFAPESRLDDGIIYLVIIRAGVGRTQLVQFLLNLSSGTHLPAPEQSNPHIEVVKVRAFRIEPGPGDGIMAVDGERVDYGAIQAEILPSVINVMVPHETQPLAAADSNGQDQVTKSSS